MFALAEIVRTELVVPMKQNNVALETQMLERLNEVVRLFGPLGETEADKSTEPAQLSEEDAVIVVVLD